MTTSRSASLFRALVVIGLILVPVTVPPSGVTKQDILSSFSSKAFAEQSTYATCFDTSFTDISSPDFNSNALCDQSVEIQEYCQPEQVTASLSAYHLYASINQSGQVMSASAAQNTTLLATPVVTPTPASVTFTDLFDATSKHEAQPFSFTTPSVSSGSVVLPIDIFGHFKTNVSTDFVDQVRANVQVDHTGDTAPAVSSSSAASYSVPAGGTADVPVSFTVTDTEANHSDLNLQLSSDNFSTVLQSHAFAAASAGSTLSYTFASLPIGDYSWRVVATETDAPSVCGSLATPPPTTFSVIDPATGLSTPISTFGYSGPGSVVCAGTNCTYTPANATDTGTHLITVDARTVDLILNPLGTPSAIAAPALTSTTAFPLHITLASAPAALKATVTAHLFYDKDANTVQDPADPDLSNVKVAVTDTSGTQNVTTDTHGNFSASVDLGVVTAQVDPTDPNLPKGYRITTGNNTQKITVSTYASIPFPAIGYTTVKSLPNAGSNQVPTFVIAIGALLSALYVTLMGRRTRLTPQEAPAETTE